MNLNKKYYFKEIMLRFKTKKDWKEVEKKYKESGYKSLSKFCKNKLLKGLEK